MRQVCGGVHHFIAWSAKRNHGVSLGQLDCSVVPRRHHRRSARFARSRTVVRTHSSGARQTRQVYGGVHDFDAWSANQMNEVILGQLVCQVVPRRHHRRAARSARG